MLRKTVLKATIPNHLDRNRVKNYDIIDLYKKHSKEFSDKQRRIHEIQRFAARKESTRNEHARRPRVTSRILLPPIASETRKKKERKMTDKTREEQGRCQLPSLERKVERRHREPVTDPRFRGLLSSLIELPKPEQFQRFVPQRRLTSTKQK